jgi:SAM-dependent methyltransferase
MSAQPRCPLCDSTGPFTEPASPSGFQLHDCTRCGMVFLHPLPNADELSLYYDQKYYGQGRQKFFSPLELAIRQLTAVKWRRLRSHVQRGDRMLDIGCGRGTMVDLARADGIEAYGLERNFPHGQRNPHIFYKDLFDCNFPKSNFHLVILWHVLEHLAEPKKTLAEIHRILVPGGYLSLAVPNYGGAQAEASGKHWFHLDLPRHFWQFRPATLQQMIEQQRFRVVRASTYSFEYDWFGTLQSWLNSSAGDDNNLFGVLKGERPLSSGASIRSLAQGSLLALPALGKAIVDARGGQGGTLFMLLQKQA